MTTLPEQFKAQKYLVLEQFVSKELLQMVLEYMWFRRETGKLKPESRFNSDRLSHEPVLDVVLDYFSILLHQATGLNLIPTYSFARIYKQNATLFRHVDRPACEVSCSVPLAYSDETDWPIYVTVDEKDMAGRAVNLKVGDMLIYKGEELWHWRGELKKQWQAQMFLHFVDAGGNNTDWQFDRRKGLSMTLRQLGLTESLDINTEQQTQVVAYELTDLLSKQLKLLKLAHKVKKLLLPLGIAGIALIAWLILK